MLPKPTEKANHGPLGEWAKGRSRQVPDCFWWASVLAILTMPTMLIMHGPIVLHVCTLSIYPTLEGLLFSLHAQIDRPQRENKQLTIHPPCVTSTL